MNYREPSYRERYIEEHEIDLIPHMKLAKRHHMGKLSWINLHYAGVLAYSPKHKERVALVLRDVAFVWDSCVQMIIDLHNYFPLMRECTECNNHSNYKGTYYDSY